MKEKTEAPANNFKHIAFLDGIRGLSAFYVILYHFLAWNVQGLPRIVGKILLPFQFGHTAVDVFIVLSGFSLMLSVAMSPERQLKGGMRDYIARRARRILPPYYAAVMLSLAVKLALHMLQPRGEYSTPATVPGFLAHMALIQNFNPNWVNELNVALWSVATEWQIYFIFPLLLLPVWRRWGNVAAIAVGLAVSFTPSFIVSLLCGKIVFFTWGCPWYVGLFAMGMACAVVYSRIAKHSSKLTGVAAPLETFWWGAAVSAVVVIVSFVAAGRGAPVSAYTTFPNYLLQIGKDGGTGGVISYLILLLAFSRGSTTNIALAYLRQILESPVARFLATFSYSLYLTHALVLVVLLSAVDNRVSPTTEFMLRACVGIPASMFLGYGFYLLFERPTIKKRALPGSE